MWSWLLLGIIATRPSVPPLTVEQYTLSNGMTVILQPDPTEPLVAVNIRYGFGSLQDPKKQKGMAHLVEHLMFERSGPETENLSWELEQAGATHVNARTGFTFTEYFELIPRESLELILWLEAERMQRITINQDILKREIRVVENEMRERRRDSPYGFAESVFLETIFPKPHPLHYGPLGLIDHLDQVSVDDIQAFHHKYYGPQNATLVVAGGFAPGSARAMVKRFFGPIPTRRALREFRPNPPEFTAKPIFAPEWIASRTRLTFAWPAPPAKTGASRNLEVLATMLRYRAALANYRETSIDGLYAFMYDTPGGRLFRIDALVTSGMSAMMARGRVESILETYVWVKPQKEELNGTKTRMRLDFLRTLASVESRAQMLQYAQDEFGKANLLIGLPSAWDRVTADSIQTVLNKYIIGRPQLAVAKPVRR